jgi:hypothetical protein
MPLQIEPCLLEYSLSLVPDGNKRAITLQKIINIGSRHDRLVVTDPTVVFLFFVTVNFCLV